MKHKKNHLTITGLVALLFSSVIVGCGSDEAARGTERAPIVLDAVVGDIVFRHFEGKLLTLILGKHHSDIEPYCLCADRT